MKLKVIITGTTGMVGEGVLRECLKNENIDRILVINRKPCGYSDPKLTEIIHKDFYDIAPIESAMTDYDACFFCLGISSVGINPDEYFKITYTLTMNFAGKLAILNPGMTFCYISGAGTDGTEKGRLRWARVKGRVENELRSLPFRQAYSFRPGFLHPENGSLHVNPWYKYVGFMYPFWRKVAPGFVTTLSELGQAMINSVIFGYDKPVLAVKDILALANRKS